MTQRLMPNPKHKTQWICRMIKRRDSAVGLTTPIVHEPWKSEDVWCVQSDTGKIITRRSGKVLVMGNCEGADFPDISLVACARATKSVGFYKQIVGRGTRTLPGTVDGLETPNERRTAISVSKKPNLLILDPLWISDRIDLCDSYDLFTDKPEAKAKMKALGPPSEENARIAERDFIKALEKEARKHARKAARVIDPLAWAVSIGDAALAHYVPETIADCKPPTQNQIAFMERNKIDHSKVKYAGLANKLIQRYMTRITLRLATPLQLTLLKQLGLPEEQAATLTMREAGAVIDRRIRERRSA